MEESNMNQKTSELRNDEVEQGTDKTVPTISTEQLTPNDGIPQANVAENTVPQPPVEYVKPEITDEEIRKSQEEANEYFNNVVKPQQEAEAKENLQQFDKIIDSEKELLGLFDESRFQVDLIVEGRTARFTIRPIESGDDLSFMDLDKDVFSDLSAPERALIQKVQAGEQLNGREKAQVDAIQAKVMENADSGEGLTMVHRLLAQHVTPPTLDGMESRIIFWQRFPFASKMILFSKVAKALGIDQESASNLFRTG